VAAERRELIAVLSVVAGIGGLVAVGFAVARVTTDGPIWPIAAGGGVVIICLAIMFWVLFGGAAETKPKVVTGAATPLEPLPRTPGIDTPGTHEAIATRPDGVQRIERRTHEVEERIPAPTAPVTGQAHSPTVTVRGQPAIPDPISALRDKCRVGREIAEQFPELRENVSASQVLQVSGWVKSVFDLLANWPMRRAEFMGKGSLWMGGYVGGRREFGALVDDLDVERLVD